MEQVYSEDQVSLIEDNEEILKAGYDSDEAESSHSRDPAEFFTTIGLEKLGEGSGEQAMVKHSFLEYLGPCFSQQTTIVAVHKHVCSNLMKRARLNEFRTYGEAVAKKCGGKANLKMAWYGGSKEAIMEILCHGFSKCSNGGGNGKSHGVGVYLTPIKRLVDALTSSVSDEYGVRHILLCHVIMGRAEVIPAGSKQHYPTSKEFDSGVDNPDDPRNYIVWGAYMNAHIFPAYVVSFKSSAFRAFSRNYVGKWLNFSAFFPLLFKHLNPAKQASMAKCIDDFKKHSVTKRQLLDNMRLIVGDDQLLAKIVKCSLEMKGPRGGGYGSRG